MDLADSRIICGPDKLVTPQLIAELKRSSVDEIRVYPKVAIRSPLTYGVQWGVCRKCYSIDLSLSQEVSLGTAVGVIAAQSIGEPGTQLTMRTFHTGGVAEAARVVVKAKSAGRVSFKDLRYENKIERARFQIDTGNDASENDSFEQDVKKIVTGGVLTIIDDNRKKSDYTLPQGSVLKVEEGDVVSLGSVLVEYNPNKYISSYTGAVKYHNIEQKDGVVVSNEGSVDILDDQGSVLDHYDIPQGATLVIEDGEQIGAGDSLYVFETEKTIAIASSTGTAGSDIKIKNQRVISENGMVFIASSEHQDKTLEAPKGVKSSATKPVGLPTDLGVILRAKSGIR